MRHVVAILGLGTVFLAGCNQTRWFHPNPGVETGMVLPTPNPTAANMVALLNDNARRLQSLESREVSMKCSQGFQDVNIEAIMVCQKPHNFRLFGKFVKSTVVDVGSNDREFWWWISKAEPPNLYHCSHEDYTRIKDRIQLPFQPDWIMEALGMSEFDPQKPYQLTTRGNNLELVENMTSPQGRPVRKVTVLVRGKNQQVQVAEHVLRDERGQEICSAKVIQSQRDRTTNAILPKQVVIRWPAEKITLQLTLNDVQVNGALPPQRVATLFSRPNMKDVQSVDLARGPDPQPTDPVRRAGGFFRNR